MPTKSRIRKPAGKTPSPRRRPTAAKGSHGNGVDKALSKRHPRRGTWRLIRIAYREFAMRLQAEFAPFRIPTSHWLHLRGIWEEPGISQTELSRSLGIEKASSTAVIEALKRRGFIYRVRDNQDKRRIGLYLTPAGRDVLTKILPIASQVHNAAHRNIPPADLDTFRRVAATLIDNLKSPGAVRQAQKAGAVREARKGRAMRMPTAP
jgi:DNA-binding MarR family transcriptional regulator